MKCLGDFGALSPQERTRLREREPAMIKPVRKAQTIYYSAPIEDSEKKKQILSVAAENTQKLKEMQQNKKQPNKEVRKPSKKDKPKKPGFFARLFGAGKKKQNQAVKNTIIPANAPVKVKAAISKAAVKNKSKKAKVKISKKVQKTAKAKGMSGNYALGDFG